MHPSKRARESAFWQWVDDEATEEEREAARQFDLYGHAEKLWKE